VNLWLTVSDLWKDDAEWDASKEYWENVLDWFKKF